MQREDLASQEPLQSKLTNPLKRKLPETTEKGIAKAKRTSQSSSSASIKEKGKKIFDATGTYDLICANRYQPVDATDFSLKIFTISESIHQVWATFEFNELKGIMRMCPSKELPLYLPDFEDACNLEDSSFPSSKSKEWFMRWRGKDEGNPEKGFVGGESRAQGQFNFSLDQKAVGPGHMRIAFGMFIDGKHLIFHGTKNADLEAMQIVEQKSIEQQWKDLANPEFDNLPDTDYDSCSSIEKKPKDPPTGYIIKAKNKPGPNPGLPPPSSPYIEERPDWAWDITGMWEVTNPREILQGFNPDGDDFDDIEKLRFKIMHANNSRHLKIGRQFFASLYFPDWTGCIRFCPTHAEEEEQDMDEEEFEKRCILEAGVWPGPGSGSGPEAGKQYLGHPDWDMIWRGYEVTEPRYDPDDGDYGQIKVSFDKNEEGRLVMNGEMICAGRLTSLKAVKIAEGKTSKYDVDVLRSWRGMLPKHVMEYKYLAAEFDR